MNFVEKFLELLGMSPSKQPGIGEVLDMPLEEQARFCDQTTFDNVNTAWGKDHVNHLSTSDFSAWNLRSVGNIACIAVSCNDPEVRETARILLAKYQFWLRLKELQKIAPRK